MLNNYGQIITPTPKGQLVRAPKGLSRPAYIQSISSKSNLFSDAVKHSETRAKQFIPGYQNSEYLGLLSIDTNGAYFGALMTMNDDVDRPFAIVGVFGMTLVKEFSIGINLYKTYDESPDISSFLSRQKSATANLIRANN